MTGYGFIYLSACEPATGAFRGAARLRPTLWLWLRWRFPTRDWEHRCQQAWGRSDWQCVRSTEPCFDDEILAVNMAEPGKASALCRRVLSVFGDGRVCVPDPRGAPRPGAAERIVCIVLVAIVGGFVGFLVDLLQGKTRATEGWLQRLRNHRIPEPCRRQMRDQQSNGNARDPPKALIHAPAVP